MKFSSSSRIGFLAAGLLAMVLAVSAQSAGAQTAWSCNGQPATIVGTKGPDALRGTNGPDVIVAREGDDIITALGGDDVVCAGKGNDEIFGGDGFDIIFAAQGNDTLYAADGATAATRADTKGSRMFGGAGNDIIHGSTKWDRMQGGIGTDSLFGYEGRDWMRAGPNNDTVDGGPGIDDMHGGNGSDIIEVTAKDIVRGGAGSDRCNIVLGEAGRMLSCGLNALEGTSKPPVSGGPGLVVIASCNAQAETVGIQNAGNTAITLNGFTLHDRDSNFEFALDGITIGPKQTVVMLSGARTAEIRGAIRWSDGNVWNNDGDTATLVRPDGTKAILGC